VGEAKIDSEAAVWVSRLDREGGDPVLLAELEAWLLADRRHQGAYIRAEAMWRTMDRACVLPAYTPAPRRLSRRVLIGGAASGVAAAAAAGAALVFAPRSQTYRTAPREIRRVQLADGSVAAINSDTEIEVAMSRRGRRVRLVRGDAWFQVAKDPERPFVVETDGAGVQAVGTAFAVKRERGLTDVLVNEGVVELRPFDRAVQPVKVEAGSRAMLHPDGRLQTVSLPLTRIEQTLAWREAQIALDGDTLGEAAVQFNRYNRRKLVISGPGLAQEPLVGWFWMDDPVSFAEAVGLSLGAEVEVLAEEIRLTRQEDRISR
jgi:transmembrane sensor